MKICYESGVSNNEYGVWGGVYLSSGLADKLKNSHKTKEIWKKVNKKMASSNLYDNVHFKHGINQWTGEPNKPVFYNDEMRRKLREIKKPLLLMMDVVKYPEFLALRLYEDNFIQFAGIEKEKVIDYVSKAKRMIESYGVRCELEGVPIEHRKL